MKKITSFFLVCFLTIFSFYYTNQVVVFLKGKDPIMQAIEETAGKYKIEALNAQIIGNNILSGKNGKDIDYEKTYDKMKRYGTYNESLTVLKETIPTISIEDNYDKYLVGGNRENRNVSLIFIIKENTSIHSIIKILDQKKVAGTFFIDGTFLEKNVNLLKNTKNHEFELLSYNNAYEESLFKTSLSYLESLSNNTPKYCYTEKDNDELLKFCKKLKLHTIKPALILKNNLYKEVKENLSNSIIISLENNSYIEKELEPTIDYIKAKGYQLTTLENLLKETY